MDTSQLQFNIIYTPHTVKYLSLFIPSLLEWMDCRFRIVANGCSSEEVELLQALCAQHDRLEFLMMSADGMIQHGHALNWLHERTDSPYFCYMDSDIIATGPFIDTVRQRLDECDVFSTGLPLWASEEDSILPQSFRRMQGSHIYTDDGVCIACDFFAIFNNERVKKIMAETGIGFQTYGWNDLPANIQQRLTRMGMAKTDYDSGKVLTCLLLDDGAKYVYEDMQHLRHLGGFSEKAGEGPAFVYRGGLDRIAVHFLGGLLARPLLYLADVWYGLRTLPVGMNKEQAAQMPFAEKRIFAGRVRKRINTARYFNVMLRAKLEGVEPPGYPLLGYPPAEKRLVDTAQRIGELVANHHTAATSPS